MGHKERTKDFDHENRTGEKQFQNQAADVKRSLKGTENRMKKRLSP
jgi:hypothetical protein